MAGSGQDIQGLRFLLRRKHTQIYSVIADMNTPPRASDLDLIKLTHTLTGGGHLSQEDAVNESGDGGWDFYYVIGG